MKGKMQSINYAGGIIAVPQHAALLVDVLEDCEIQSRAFDYLVIVLSGFSRNERTRVEREIAKRNFNDVEIISVSSSPPGFNRNTILSQMTHDIGLLTFMDADDRYIRVRNERILRQYCATGFDALIHATLPSWPGYGEYLRDLLSRQDFADPPIVLTSKQLYDENFLNNGRNRSQEASGKTNTSLKIPRGFGNFSIHHGHVTLSKPSMNSFRYHESFKPRNEDSLFVRDLLYGNLKIEAVMEILSIYSVGTSTARENWVRSLARRVARLGK
jgi:glycosyltransferase involved in cell wall biosynthesis